MPTALINEIIMGLVALLASTYLGIAILLRNHKSWTNRLFALLTLVINIYIVVNFLSLHPPVGTPENQLFWIRIVMFVCSFFAPILVLLIHTFPHDRITLKSRYITVLTLLMVASAIASLTSLVFKSIEYPNGEPIPIASYGMPIFFLDFIGLFIFSFALLIIKYSHSRDAEKIQLRYLLAGIIASFSIMGITTVIFVVALKTSSFVFLGPIAPVILMASIAYAIAKHRFLDIQPVIARATSYAFLIVFLAISYAALLFGGTSLFFGGLAVDIRVIILAIILTVAAILTFNPLREISQRLTDRFLFKGQYNADNLLSNLTRMMMSTIDLDLLTRNITMTLVKEMRVSRATFLIVERHVVIAAKGIGFENVNFNNTALENFLHLKEARRTGAILLEDLTDPKLQQLFRQSDISVLIPIKAEDNEIALLILGSKLAGDMYSAKDIAFLELFASEAGISIQKSKLYDDLKQALAAKSEFLSVVSHQMRTPISGIRWSLELLQKPGLSADKRKEFLENAYHNSIFMNEQLDDILIALDIQDKTTSLNKEICDLRPISNELLLHFDHEINEKNLKTGISLGENYSVPCDMSKIKKVIGILIKNAITYTPKGGKIEVSSGVKNIGGVKELLVTVSDTGIGITDDEKKQVFDKFYRSARAKLVLPDGMGLGMFIAKAYIEAHGGKLWVESAGKDKGSTFYFTLPIKNNQGIVSQ